MQAKCSRDAKVFFNEGWRGDKDTIILNYSNHYNKRENKCFIIVENHYNSHFAMGGGTSWTNDMNIYDVYENIQYGHFAENHYVQYKPKISSSDEFLSCEVSGQKCTDLNQFNTLAARLMND